MGNGGVKVAATREATALWLRSVGDGDRGNLRPSTLASSGDNKANVVTFTCRHHLFASSRGSSPLLLDAFARRRGRLLHRTVPVGHFRSQFFDDVGVGFGKVFGFSRIATQVVEL